MLFLLLCVNALSVVEVACGPISQYTPLDSVADSDTIQNEKFKDRLREQRKLQFESRFKKSALPFTKLLAGKSKEWTNFKHTRPLKRSNEPLFNSMNETFPNGLECMNGSNPISKYRCPINLLYGNNLTVKNYIIMMPNDNASCNIDRPNIEKLESSVEEGHFTIGKVKIPESKVEKEQSTTDSIMKPEFSVEEGHSTNNISKKNESSVDEGQSTTDNVKKLESSAGEGHSTIDNIKKLEPPVEEELSTIDNRSLVPLPKEALFCVTESNSFRDGKSVEVSSTSLFDMVHSVVSSSTPIVVEKPVTVGTSMAVKLSSGGAEKGQGAGKEVLDFINITSTLDSNMNISMALTMESSPPRSNKSEVEEVTELNVTSGSETISIDVGVKGGNVSLDTASSAVISTSEVNEVAGILGVTSEVSHSEESTASCLTTVGIEQTSEVTGTTSGKMANDTSGESTLTTSGQVTSTISGQVTVSTSGQLAGTESAVNGFLRTVNKYCETFIMNDSGTYTINPVSIEPSRQSAANFRGKSKMKEKRTLSCDSNLGKYYGSKVPKKDVILYDTS